MNHTQRIAHVARQRRSLTKAVVRESVERYLEALAEEIASGEWVDYLWAWDSECPMPVLFAMSAKAYVAVRDRPSVARSATEFELADTRCAGEGGEEVQADDRDTHVQLLAISGWVRI